MDKKIQQITAQLDKAGVNAGDINWNDYSIAESEENEPVKEIPVTGVIKHDNEGWWITLYQENSNIVIGSADEYRIPNELVERMNLNSLLENQ